MSTEQPADGSISTFLAFSGISAASDWFPLNSTTVSDCMILVRHHLELPWFAIKMLNQIQVMVIKSNRTWDSINHSMQSDTHTHTHIKKIINRHLGTVREQETNAHVCTDTCTHTHALIQEYHTTRHESRTHDLDGYQDKLSLAKFPHARKNNKTTGRRFIVVALLCTWVTAWMCHEILCSRHMEHLLTVAPALHHSSPKGTK